MPLNIIRNDISKVRADAIVNTANPEVAVGAGVDQAIYEAAGMDQLLEERAKIGPMKPGQAAVTPAFGLDAKYIIHTVGPAWEGGDHGEREAVASCYKESLKLADELDCESVAFPLISTGTYGFPKDEALQIAIREISSFLFEHDMNVYMVVYDKESFVISGKAFSGVRTYIEERDVHPTMVSAARDSSIMENRRRRRMSSLIRREKTKEYLEEKDLLIQDASVAGGFDAAEAAAETAPAAEDLDEAAAEAEGAAVTEAAVAPELDELTDLDNSQFVEMDIPVAASYSMPHTEDYGDLGRTLEEILRRRKETFQQRLFRLIDRRGLKDSEVYHKANISRKLFSKIRSDVNYKPSKKTALAFAIALELNLDETLDLIGSAGYTLSDASVFDLIVKYCIIHKIYDIFEVNNYLFIYTDQVLAV